MPKKPLMIKASQGHLSSAIWNLLNNAYKFTPAGGRISLRVTDQDNWLRIEVADTGIGISDEEKPRVFTKFHRSTGALEYDYEGTGIGLYITKLVIEQHGGTIDFTSQLGKGTSFVIKLPLQPAPA